MNAEELIQGALRSGKYLLGSRRTIKALKSGKAKAVIIAKNCPEKFLVEIKKFNTPIYTFEGTNMELGAKFGKPFSVAALVILE
ncbi:MAG: 50S ribosomal protein L30e [Archaeoglobaceae archaeon]|nr:50S ribosomal protein L30e [Archaeoglobaceae archaeon]MCX8152783.1 50S ribosomal protein L30e [Archaeoglobaceae archaeon]MDW8013490.1 50S ribosomal protein L30e [Archaeoglobaceae archaeon]